MKKSRRRSASEGQALIKRYEASELTQRDFADRDGVTVATLQYWLRKMPEFSEEDRFAVEGPSLNDELVLVNEEKRWYRLRNGATHVLFVRDAAGDRWEGGTGVRPPHFPGWRQWAAASRSC